MDREGKRVTKGETIAMAGIGVALLGVMIASWADNRAGFSELRAEIGDHRRELKQDIASSRAELKQDIASLRAELRQDISALRLDVRGLDDRLDEVNVRLVAVEIHAGVGKVKPPRDGRLVEGDAD